MLRMYFKLSLGGTSEAEPPVPIPNTEVKRFSTYDTALATAWENRPLPGDFFNAPVRANNSLQEILQYSRFRELFSKLIVTKPFENCLFEKALETALKELCFRSALPERLTFPIIKLALVG